jgi:hypothetical protein
MNYPYSIRSIVQIYPPHANDLNMLDLQGINASNEIGTPIDPHAVMDVEDTVAILSGANSERVYFSMSTIYILLLAILPDPGR